MRSAFVLFLMITGLLWPAQDQSVELFNQKNREGTGVQIFGRNTNFYPVTVETTFSPVNMENSKRGSSVYVLNAHSQREIAEFSAINPAEDYSVNYKYKFYMGSIFAKHDDRYAYRLPFSKGSAYRLDQGYGGDFSHYGDMTYALDFNMPEGTPVYAARNGLVVSTEDRYDRGGASRDFLRYSNNITILHEDGTFADYAHLQKDGVIVKAGQRVSTGQHIGYSGATGFTSGPHLHFAVKRATRGGQYITVPVKFRTVGGIMDELQEGKTYTSY